MEDRIIQLETRIAFQDRTIDELNQVVIMLRDTVENLQKKVANLEELVSEMQADKDKDISDEIPPHY
ncbi:MAG: SlyX family protein [Chitinispirillaceae bacterium]